MLSDRLQEKVLLDVLRDVVLIGPDQALPSSVRVKHGVNRNGKAIHYFLNYAGDSQTITYAYGDGSDLLTQSAVEHSQQVTLKPWDLAIIEEK